MKALSVGVTWSIKSGISGTLARRLFVFGWSLCWASLSFSAYGRDFCCISAKDATGVERTTFAVGELITFQFSDPTLPSRPDNVPFSYGIGWYFGDGCTWVKRTRASKIEGNAQQYVQWSMTDGSCRSITRASRSGGGSLVHEYTNPGTYTVFADVGRDNEWLAFPQNLGPIIGWAEKTITVVTQAGSSAILMPIIDLLLDD